MAEQELIESAIKNLGLAAHWTVLSIKDTENLMLNESMKGVSIALIATLITNVDGYEEDLANAVEFMKKGLKPKLN
jgi:hypothetical protein